MLLLLLVLSFTSIVLSPVFLVKISLFILSLIMRVSHSISGFRGFRHVPCMKRNFVRSTFFWKTLKLLINSKIVIFPGILLISDMLGLVQHIKTFQYCFETVPPHVSPLCVLESAPDSTSTHHSHILSACLVGPRCIRPVVLTSAPSYYARTHALANGFLAHNSTFRVVLCALFSSVFIDVLNTLRTFDFDGLNLATCNSLS